MFDDGFVLETVEQLVGDAAKVASSPMWSLADDDLAACVQAAHRLEQAAAALKARLVHHALTREVPGSHGHRTAAGWLRAHLLLDPQPARELVDQAAALGRHAALESAVLDGDVDLRQAAAIAAAVDAIPATLESIEDGLSPESGARVADEAAALLIKMAARFPAYQLRRLGERILGHVAPEIAERADEVALRRQEARAHAKRSLTLSLPFDGLVRLTGVLGVEDAAVITAALHPLCSPAPGDDRTHEQRRADALVDICRLALRTGELPDHGGEPAQVAVTIPYDPLAATLRTGVLDNGERVSPDSARRLACDARILPLVLGGAGQVLDAGRSRRLATGALRRALVARDGGCAFPDCDRPARWCDAHHLRPWSRNGRTSLDNLVLLCRHHHRTVHDPALGWRVVPAADGLPNFIPPPWTDPERRPRRNLYHPRK